MNKNPYDICTHNQQSDCINCDNYQKIDCKRNDRRVKVSLLIEFSFIVLSLFGTYIAGIIIELLWIPLGYLFILILVFFVIQPRVTCSHCPYYAGKGKILHCSENIFSPKIWKFHPEPINKIEKMITIICFSILGLYPLILELNSLWIVYNSANGTFLMLTLIYVFLGNLFVILLFYYIFLSLYCTHCVNFSCLFNKVPKINVDEYLKRNPVMKNAWENKGYKIDSQ
jgi:hypothetical protein